MWIVRLVFNMDVNEEKPCWPYNYSPFYRNHNEQRRVHRERRWARWAAKWRRREARVKPINEPNNVNSLSVPYKMSCRGTACMLWFIETSSSYDFAVLFIFGLWSASSAPHARYVPFIFLSCSFVVVVIVVVVVAVCSFACCIDSVSASHSIENWSFCCCCCFLCFLGLKPQKIQYFSHCLRVCQRKYLS